MSVEYIIAYIEKEHLISVAYSGIADSKSVEKMYLGARTVAKQKACNNILIDISNLSLQLAPTDLRALIAAFAHSLVGLNIARVSNISNYRHDLTCQVLSSHSVNIHDFDDIASAKQWLSEQD